MTAGGTTLTAPEHPGGSIDWHSFSVSADTATAAPTVFNRTVFPAPVRFSGMPLPRWWAMEDGRTNFAAVQPDSTDIIRSFDPGYVAAPGSARTFLAFKLDSPAAVDATYGQLVAAGYHGHLAPWDAFWGEHYARIHDPDGNTVDLFAGPAANASSSETSAQ